MNVPGIPGGAVRVLASTYGTLVGLAGIEHGVFELLQGHTKPDGLMIDAIGPAQRFWEHASETALTVIPSFLITGIFAIIIGVAVVIWSATMVHRKLGPVVLLGLCIVLFLVGGGFGPIFMSLLAFGAASRIGKPLRWWRAHLRGSLRALLSALFPWLLGVFVLVFVVGVEIAIFGDPLASMVGADAASRIQYGLAYAMVALMILCVPCSFARDITTRSNAEA
jgi:hypothetical protein